jgi:hypothetical protein
MRAAALKEIIVEQGPAFVKAGGVSLKTST